MKKVLVTGGAGYIGSHVTRQLREKGHDVVVADNLSTGTKGALLGATLVELDLSDDAAMKALFKREKFDSVLHFAGSIVVPESVRDPIRYYQNNTQNSLKLLAHCQEFGVKKLIFSSTAATYGLPQSGVASEETPQVPINPYGASKLMTEWMLKDYAYASDFRFVALRYFNVSGADLEGRIGQCFPGATHLIKVSCEAATGKRPGISIYGTDYPTPDGTCIRDYIHVEDLADAHLRALDYLNAGGESQFLNCGYGHGASVREVIAMVKKISGVNFKVEEAGRREGDPPKLISKAEKIRKVLGWTPKHDDLGLIVKTAYNWERKLLQKS